MIVGELEQPQLHSIKNIKIMKIEIPIQTTGTLAISEIRIIPKKSMAISFSIEDTSLGIKLNKAINIEGSYFNEVAQVLSNLLASTEPGQQILGHILSEVSSQVGPLPLETLTSEQINDLLKCDMPDEELISEQ